MRVLDLYEIANIDEPLTRYRQHEGQVSRNNQMLINELTLRIIGLKILSNITGQTFMQINEDFSNIENMQLFIKIKYKITRLETPAIQRYRRDLSIWALKKALMSIAKLQVVKAFLSIKIIYVWWYPL
jgi:hypothetical protein